MSFRIIIIFFFFPVFQLSLDGRTVLFWIRKGKAAIEHATLHAGITRKVIYLGTKPFYFVRATP